MALRLKILGPLGEKFGERGVMEFGPAGGTIGRSLDCDWALPDRHRYLSSRHASIDFRGGCYYVVDTSTNGVYVNDADHPVGRGTPQRLFNGDRVRMGEYLLAVEIADDTIERLIDQNHVNPVPLTQRVEAPAEPTSEMVDAHEITGVGIEMMLTEDEIETLTPPPKGRGGFFEFLIEDDSSDPAKTRPFLEPAPRRGREASSRRGSTEKRAADPTLDSGESAPSRTHGTPSAQKSSAAAQRAANAPPASRPSPASSASPAAASQTAAVPPPAAPAVPFTTAAARQPRADAPAPHAFRNSNTPVQRVSAATPSRTEAAASPRTEATASPRTVAAATARVTAAAPHTEAAAAPREQAAIRAVSHAADSTPLAAFFRGAGIDPRRVAPHDSEAVLYKLGKVMREMVAGISEGLNVCAQQKNLLAIDSEDALENPLKSDRDLDEKLLELILTNDQPAHASIIAVRAAFDDVNRHQQVMLKAFRTALDTYIARLDPDEVEQKYGDGGRYRKLLSAANKLKYWALYKDVYDVVAHHPPGELPMQFVEDLANAYRQLVESGGDAAEPDSSPHAEAI